LPGQCIEQHRRIGCLVWLVNSTPLSFSAAFVQLAFWKEFKLLLSNPHTVCRHIQSSDTTHSQAHKSQTLRWHHSTPVVSAQPPAHHLGKSPSACPATRAWNTHPEKQKGWAVEASRGQEVASGEFESVRFGDGKGGGNFREKNAEENTSVRLIWGEQSGCWLEGLSGERWNWRRIIWTLGFKRRRAERAGCFERRSGCELLALRQGLRHASHLCEPLGPDAQEGSQPNLCYSRGVGSDKAYQHVWHVRAVGWETQFLVGSDAGHL